MKVLSLFVASLVLNCGTVAWAVPPLLEVFKKSFVKEGEPLELRVAELKCAVCHDAKVKKVRNEFGNVVGKYLDKEDFAPGGRFRNAKAPPAQEAMKAAIESAVVEEYKDGRTYRELIESGELPFASRIPAEPKAK